MIKVASSYGCWQINVLLDYCDDGNLIFFPDATHWVQHEEAEEVNRHLWEFVST